jgi:tetratricopeptide (TPR) repeat protein
MAFEEKRYAEAETAFRALLAEDPASADGWSGLGHTLRALKQHAGAADALARSVGTETGGHAAWVMYQAAVQYALAGRKDEAFTTLGRAFEMGYPDRDVIEKDADLASLRADPRAKQLAVAR